MLLFPSFEIFSIYRFASVVAFSLLVICFAVGKANDPIKVKLDAAKKTYSTDMDKFQKAVTDWFDKREKSAREIGNKKEVDKIKIEREAFVSKAELGDKKIFAIGETFEIGLKSEYALYDISVNDKPGPAVVYDRNGQPAPGALGILVKQGTLTVTGITIKEIKLDLPPKK
jgi:hypothetical protein